MGESRGSLVSSEGKGISDAWNQKLAARPTPLTPRPQLWTHLMDMDAERVDFAMRFGSGSSCEGSITRPFMPTPVDRCSPLRAPGPPQGWDSRTPSEDSFIYALAECTPGPVFLDGRGQAGSHSAHEAATFRIVSSLTFFPRSSRLLDWKAGVTLPGPSPQEDRQLPAMRPWVLGRELSCALAPGWFAPGHPPSRVWEPRCGRVQAFLEPGDSSHHPHAGWLGGAVK